MELKTRRKMKYIRILFTNREAYDYAVLDYNSGKNLLCLEYTNNTLECLNLANIDSFQVSNEPFSVEENCEVISQGAEEPKG